MGLRKPIAEHLHNLRKLETAAKADPGHEVEHDHESTAEYDAYAQAWRQLAEMTDALPQPEGWLELERWCDGNPHQFGNVVYPGAHWAAMGWNPTALSVRGLILMSILRRARQRQTRSQDEPLWTDPRVVDLLRTWTERHWAVPTLAQILVFLPSASVAAVAQALRERFILLPARTLQGHQNIVFSVSFSPDGMLLASGSSDDTVKLWGAQTGELKRTLTGHQGTVLSVAFSPDGTALASASWDGTVNLWDPETGALKQTLAGHEGKIYSVAFAPDGRRLAGGGDGGDITIWDTATGSRLPWKLVGDDCRARRGDDQVLAFMKQMIGEWNYTVQSVAFPPDGGSLAAGCTDETIKIWDLTGC